MTTCKENYANIVNWTFLSPNTLYKTYKNHALDNLQFNTWAQPLKFSCMSDANDCCTLGGTWENRQKSGLKVSLIFWYDRENLRFLQIVNSVFSCKERPKSSQIRKKVDFFSKLSFVMSFNMLCSVILKKMYVHNKPSCDHVVKNNGLKCV